MNEPTEQPRMSSLDRRIEVARLRAERERAAAHPQPTQGLTSTMSTESCDIAQPRNKQPLLVIYHEPPIVHAMAVLRQAMQEDPGYAQGWHDNIAMAFKDSWEQQAAEEGKNISTSTRNLVHRQANRAAAHFMHVCFNADTSKHAAEVIGTANAWQDTQPIKPNLNPVVGPDSVPPNYVRTPEGLAKMQSCHKRGLDRLLYAPKETPADPVHTIIQQEAATAETQRFVHFRTPSFSGHVTAEPNISLPVPDKQSLQACSLDELKIYSEAIGYEARSKLMQKALVAASKPLISQVIAREVGSGGAPQASQQAQLSAGNDYQQGTDNAAIGKGCDRNGVPTK